MKIKFYHLLSLFLLPIFFVLIADDESSDKKEDPPEKEFATVVRVKGKVSVWRKLIKEPVTAGDKVNKGETIQTSKNAQATVLLANGHKVYVFGGSKLKIDKKGDGKTMINHDLGSIWMKVKKLKQGESFQVKMPSAVAGVRGTGFTTSITDNGIASLCVCEGEVEVESGGVKKIIQSGHGTKLMKGQPPGEVHGNFNLIRQKRKLSRRPSCINCHSGSYGDTSTLNGGLIDDKNIEKKKRRKSE